MTSTSLARILAIAALVALAAAGCASSSTSPATTDSPVPAGSSSASGPTTNVPRPSTTAQLTIVSPTPHQAVTGSTIHVVVDLTGATIVSATTIDIRPDQGHIHLYVDGNLVSMNYGTTQDLPAVPGTHTLHAEFVASDHYPFSPRVITPDVIFTVKP